MKLKRIINKHGFFAFVPDEAPVEEKPKDKKAPIKKKVAKKK